MCVVCEDYVCLIFFGIMLGIIFVEEKFYLSVNELRSK